MYDFELIMQEMQAIDGWTQMLKETDALSGICSLKTE